MKKLHYALLILVFMFTLGSRLYFSFSTSAYSSDTAYFAVRQIENIQQTSSPLYDDHLSFSGRMFIFPPLFEYLLAFLALVFPVGFAAKFFPNLFASSLIFFTYLIARRITKNSQIALFTAFISGFIPIFFQQTFNNISVYSLVIPLFFLLLYSFMNLNKKKLVYCYIITIIVLTLIHPSVILFIIGLWFYLLLVKLEGLKQSQAELEIVIFSTFFVILSQFIMFKKVFLFHGPLVIWQNIPKEILSNYFAQVSILQAIYYIGIIPALCGAYIIYRYIFKEKRQDIYLIVGFIFSVALLLWLRLIEIKLGLMFLGVLIVLLFAQFYKLFVSYIESTRASKLGSFFAVLIFLLFIFTSVIPSFSLARLTIETSVTEGEIAALEWINQNTPQNSVILATVGEGNLITAIAKRKNVIDSNFLLITDSKQRFSDVNRAFSTFSVSEAVSILNKYDVDYLYFSQKAESSYNINVPRYADDRCFHLVYNKEVKIYKSVCRMEELK
ncbi:glycosyltransferase family 39 protein [Candidatus Woesearchaeota archaeon]|nr:glycosyltransferase family 39 protein [Candidatus Woesearchaeota archaeon]